MTAETSPKIQVFLLLPLQTKTTQHTKAETHQHASHQLALLELLRVAPRKGDRQLAKVDLMNESEDWGFGQVHETDPTFHRLPNTV